MFKRFFLTNKVFFIFVLCSALILSLATTDAFAAKPKKKIFIVLFHSEQDSERSFKEVMNEHFDVDWTMESPNRDKAKVKEIMERIPADTDLVYCYGTTVGKMAREIIVEKRGMTAVYCNSFDPVGAGISDSWDRAGARIVGGTIKVPAEVQLNIVKKLGNYKRIAVVYNPNETNGRIGFEEIDAIKGQYGYEIIPIAYLGPDDVGKMKNELQKSKAELVILTSSSSIMTKPTAVTEALIEMKLPTVSPSVQFAKDGALISLGVSYGKLGRRVGEESVKILNGADPTNMPVIQVDKFDMLVNLVTADKIGISIPLSILRTASEIIRE
ncbi:MAG: ABC transporter substrate-binding protein [Candidatus Omnitrophota bacterium]